MASLFELTVNGSLRKVEADPRRSLLSVLRDDLDITGPKYGCGEGKCGACTVLLDGQAARSCIVPIRVAAGKAVTTIEGLERDGKLHPVQEAFLEAGAMQCGYCTPGMILSTVSLLSATPRPTDDQVVEGLRGNICRCCVYPRIREAVRIASSAMAEKKP